MKYLLPILLAVLLGCTQDIDLDIPEHNPRIAFTGLIQDSITTFFVTQSSKENFGTYPGLTDAIVTVRDDNGNQWIATPGSSEGYFEINQPFTENVQYHVSIEQEGLPPAKASTGLPGKVQIIEAEGQQASTIDSLDVYQYYSTYFCEVNLDVQPGPDFQSVLIKPILVYAELDGRTTTLRPATLKLSQDLPLDYVYIEDGFILTRKDFEKLNGTLNILFSTYSATKPENDVRILMEVGLLSESYDSFLKSAIENLNTDIEILFSEPIPLYSNVEGGYGFFGAIQKDSVVIPVR